MVKTAFLLAALVVSSALAPVQAQVKTFGDQDVLGTGTYGFDPLAGATLTGLMPNAVTFATDSLGHTFPFSPAADDFSGTDQIYTSTNQTASGDGYSGFDGRLNGPQVFTLDYGSLVAPGATITSLTLGIAADDFQFNEFGQSFSATINGASNSSLSTVLNGLQQNGPRVQFFTIGVAPSALASNHVLTLAINQDGDGRDGWAVDFLTVGVTVAPVPEPSTLLMLGAGGLVMLRRVRRQRFVQS